jgi:phytoene dehydrogenase-like protein
MPKPERAVIIGAGIAGLTCARELARAGVSPLVLEASDGVGGRMRTDLVEGFRLDRGFQVFLTASPEAKRQLDYAALDLAAFEPGALVYRGGKLHRLMDPWRRPRNAVATAFAPIGTVMDKLRITQLRSAARSETVEGLFHAPERSSETTLRDGFGFSEGMVEGFLRPFFAGLFLERELATSDRMLHFVFRMFSDGAAALPAAGIEAIPRQLAAALPPPAIRLDTRVVEAGPQHVTVESGERIEAQSVVLAVDGETAAGLSGGEVRPPRWNGTACLYFDAPGPPIGEPIVVLNGEPGEGPVNEVAIPSNAQQSYTPPGRSLVSASTIGVPEMDDQALRQAVLDQLRKWFGPAVGGWRHLKTYRLPKAVPAFMPPTAPPQDRLVRLENGLYVCGDHWSVPNLNAAMESGRRVAEAILGERRY